MPSYCKVLGCGKRASFGRPGEKATHCKTHSTDGMENGRHKRCQALGCKKVPSFGRPGEKATRCKTHSTDDMVNVVVSPVCVVFFVWSLSLSRALRAQSSSVQYLICFCSWREPWVFIERATCTTFISPIFERQLIVSILFKRVEDDGIQADTEETGSPGTGVYRRFLCPDASG